MPANIDSVWSEVMKAEEAFRQATSLASKRHALDRLGEALAQYCHLTVSGRPVGQPYSLISAHGGQGLSIRR